MRTNTLRAERVLKGMTLEFDPDLLASAQSGPAGLGRLIEAVWPETYRIARSILHDPDAAEDAAQEACAAIASSLSTLKDTRAFRSWMYRIAANEALALARRQRRTLTLETLGDYPGEADVNADALDLSNAMARLPLKQRAVLVLHYYAGLNSGEIADATGLPSSTVRFHLMLARRGLRRALCAPRKEAVADAR